MPAVESRLVDDADEELRAAAVGPPRHGDGGDRAPDVPRLADLVRDEAEAAPPVVGRPLGIGGQRVAALHDAESHHPVKGGAVERPVGGEPHHEADVVGRQLGAQIDRDLPEIGGEDGLLAGHLVHRERRDERLAVLREGEGRNGEPDEQGGNASQGNGSHGDTSQ